MKLRILLVALVLTGTLGLTQPAGATGPGPPGPAHAVCFRTQVVTNQMVDFFTPMFRANWRLYFSWCSTGILWGHVFGYRQHHEVDHMDGLLNDEGITENQGHFFAWQGRVKGGYYAHVKGKVANCFFGWCNYLYPWANVWVYADGSYHFAHGIG